MKLCTIILGLMTLTAALPSVAQQSLSTGINPANLNTHVAPADDFYEFATGGWAKAHPLTPEYSRYSQFLDLEERNGRLLRTMIEELASRPHPQGSLEQKIGSLYRLAMDSTRREADDFAPLQAELTRIDEAQTRADIQYEMARLQSMGIGVFFQMGCYADMKNAAWNIVQVDQGGLSMGERDYYLGDDEATLEVRKAFLTYVERLFTMTGFTLDEARQAACTVLDLETSIARASYSATELRDVEKNYHRMSYRALLSDFGGIDWSTIFMQCGVPAFDSISVNQPEPIHEVEKLLAETDIAQLKTFLRFKLIDDATTSLSDRFTKASFDFYEHAMGGAEEEKPRWKRAVSAVEQALGMALGRLYVERYFPESSKKRMLSLVSNLQLALGQRIDAQEWMTQATKEKAHEKLNAFYVKIGYPDKWIDYTKLEIDENLSYYENKLRARRFMSDYIVEHRVNKPVDRDEWLMTPQAINAYYNFYTNEICFPAGILQPPFFNVEADDAYNYGAIGMVIGHEMTHGFDDQGSQFDKNGNLSNWWTDSDKAQFNARTKVLAESFDKMEVLPGLTINGELTLGENIADHGGLQIAYLALQNAMKQQPLSTKDGYTPEQRFFLSYAQLWAGNIRDAALRQQVMTDPHSPARFRVNGALAHIDDWYKAFKVTKKSPLYIAPQHRVKVW